jgi:hypothetical protein
VQFVVENVTLFVVFSDSTSNTPLTNMMAPPLTPPRK